MPRDIWEQSHKALFVEMVIIPSLLSVCIIIKSQKFDAACSMSSSPCRKYDSISDQTRQTPAQVIGYVSFKLKSIIFEMPVSACCPTHSTLFCNFNFTAAEFSLLDVLHTEVTAAVSVDLGFVPGGRLIIGAVGVGRSWEMNIKGHYCGNTYKRANHEIYTSNLLCVGWSLCVCVSSVFPVCVQILLCLPFNRNK